MNMHQMARYGRLSTYTDLMRRYCDCPLCSFRASAMRRGPGNGNALATAARLKGQVMTHMREKHAADLQAELDAADRRSVD